jgi:hypothetical protein
MAFFLETLLGGLMAGMLYSLVALGFVLIFKASGVFNFAQGAMVLFAALAMARFAEWVPKWTGTSNTMVATALAFLMAGAVMFLVAWLIERLVLRHLVNQEGTTLLMATLGITYLLEGLGQTIFGSDIYKIDIGMPKEPIFMLEGMFPGGVLVNKEDVIAAAIAATLVAALSVFFQKTSTGRALRACRRRPPGRPVDRHSPEPHLGHRLVRRRHRRAGGRDDLGLQAGCAVLAGHRGAARTAGRDPGRPDFGAGRHHRRPDHWRGREVVGGVPRTVRGRGHRDLVRLCAGPRLPAVQASRSVRRKNH